MDLQPIIKLPFVADNCHNLPTLDEIHTRGHLIDETGIGIGKVVSIRQYVVKIKDYADGYTSSSPEVDNMAFLDKYAPGTSPKLYAAYKNKTIWPWPEHLQYRPDNFSFLYLVMEKVPGHTVSHLWNSGAIDEEDLKMICRKVRSHLDFLRAFDPPPNVVGRITSAPLRCGTNSLVHGKGTFKSVGELVETIFTSLRPRCEARNSERLHEFMDYGPRVLTRDTSVRFTHGDLHFGNIVAEPIKLYGRIIDWNIRIIDWYTAGWYPAWWDFCFMANYTKGTEAYQQNVTETLDPYWMESKAVAILFDLSFPFKWVL